MSHRTLARIRPEEITRIIGVREAQIAVAVQANADAEAAAQERQALAERASRVLNYPQLAQATKFEARELPVDLVLLKTLQALGIRPFDPASVARYMKQTAGNRLNLLMKGLGMPLTFSGGLATLIVLIDSFISSGNGKEAYIHQGWGALLGIGLFLIWAEHALIPRTEWVRRELRNAQSGLIPRPVLESALAVIDKLPDARFWVHELENDFGPWFKIFDQDGGFLRNLSDPFLEVRWGSESYIIAVWDEPGFDGKELHVT